MAKSKRRWERIIARQADRPGEPLQIENDIVTDYKQNMHQAVFGRHRYRRGVLLGKKCNNRRYNGDDEKGNLADNGFFTEPV